MHCPWICVIRSVLGLLWMCYNTKDRMADLRSGWSKCPYPQAEHHRCYSPSPTALCLWLDPRSAVAGPPAPPSTDINSNMIPQNSSIYCYYLSRSGTVYGHNLACPSNTLVQSQSQNNYLEIKFWYAYIHGFKRHILMFWEIHIFVFWQGVR